MRGGDQCTTAFMHNIPVSWMHKCGLIQSCNLMQPSPQPHPPSRVATRQVTHRSSTGRILGFGDIIAFEYQQTPPLHFVQSLSLYFSLQYRFTRSHPSRRIPRDAARVPPVCSAPANNTRSNPILLRHPAINAHQLFFSPGGRPMFTSPTAHRYAGIPPPLDSLPLR